MDDAASGVQSNSDFITDSLANELTGEVNAMAGKGRAVGGFAVLVRNGEIAWEMPFGKSDIEAGAVFDRHTLFRIGSVTKTFTATAIFQLRDKGELSLDDPLSKFIPEIANAAAIKDRVGEITLRRVLSHTAGLTSAAPVGRPYFTEEILPDREEVLASLPNMSLIGDPGSTPKYSNFGFALLGDVIKRVSGQPSDDYIVSNICKPLGLESTRFELSNETKSRAATGYSRLHTTSNVRVEEFPDLKFDSAAGALYSNAHDLALWLGFHLSDEDHTVLSARSRKEMRQPQFLSPDWSRGNCMNWMASRVGEVMAFGHGGGIPGFVTDFKMVPAMGFGVITMVNTWLFDSSIGNKMIEKIAAHQKQLSEAAEPPEARLATEPPAELAPFQGIYLFDGKLIIWVEWWNDGLSVRMDPVLNMPGGRSKLLPTDDPHVFTVESGMFAGEPIGFEQTDDGMVTGFTWSAFLVRRVGGFE